jgi:hypothetical protein
LNAFGILGRILPAYLSDILGHFNVLFPSAFFLGLSCLTLWLFATSPVTIFVFAAFYGFWSGAFVSIVTSCAAKLSEVGERGTRIGMLFSIVSVPCVSTRLPTKVDSSIVKLMRLLLDLSGHFWVDLSLVSSFLIRILTIQLGVRIHP